MNGFGNAALRQQQPSAKQLAYLKDSTGLSKADRKVRAETRKLGTDLVSNLIAGLKKREVKEARAEELHENY